MFTVPCEAIATYQYDLPIFHFVRPGSIVATKLGNVDATGCINDLEVP